MRLFILLLSILFVTMSTPLYAQEVQEGASAEEPLEITADGSLEWNRTAKTFTATKAATATQGDTTIEADTLEAHYREEEDNAMVLYKMLAVGNVKITSNDSIAYGDNAEYDIDSGKAVMTGESLKMESDDQTLTATDNFEYWVEDGRITANGNVKIIRPKKAQNGSDTLEAATVSAYLKENKKGKRVLDRLVAQQDVKITTPTETLRGKKATYLALTNIAEVSGNVSITRGKNKLEGARASVDLNTNISRMFASGKGTATKRVRGTFYPGSTKKDDESEQEILPELEGYTTPEAMPKNIQRIRPNRPRSAEREQLAPVQLKKPESLKEPEEEMMLVPDNKTPQRVLTTQE